MNRLYLLGGYALIMATCIVLAVYVIAQPEAGAPSDRSTNFLAGAGIGFAGCIFLKDGSGVLLSRLGRQRRAAQPTPPPAG
jgi:hypothetical protein